jgi:hypothetical protein
MTPLKLSGNEALRSWGMIATFLKCGIRTAQRWEREEQLPVHRRANAPRGMVVAFPRELQTWLSTRDGDTDQDKSSSPERVSMETSQPASLLDTLCWRARERSARVRGAWPQLLKSS